MKRWTVWAHRGRQDQWTLKERGSYLFRWRAVLAAWMFCQVYGWGEAGIMPEGESPYSDAGRTY